MSKLSYSETWMLRNARSGNLPTAGEVVQVLKALDRERTARMAAGAKLTPRSRASASA